MFAGQFDDYLLTDCVIINGNVPIHPRNLVLLIAMLKLLFKNLIFNFIISSLTAVVAFAVNHYFHDFLDFDSDLYGLMEFAVMSNFVLSVLSLPALFVSKQYIRERPVLRFICFYIGLIIPLIYFLILCITIEYEYAEDWLVILIILNYMIPYTVFYIKMIKNHHTIT